MDHTTFYDNLNWEKAELKKKLTEKINLIINSIPKDVTTIIDVGCGDGTIANALSEKYNIVAVDTSVKALRYVKTKKLSASADNLSFRTNEFDLVFSSEMIEHLPENIYTKSIDELKRVSGKYIFLTFPNDENIEKQVTECTNCNYVFNKSYHLRSINIDTIKNIFSDYKVTAQFEYGLKVRDYSHFLSKWKHKLTPGNSWIPYFWTKDGHRKTVCPKCSHSYNIPYKFNGLSFSFDLLNILFSVKRPYQLCVLLERK